MSAAQVGNNLMQLKRRIADVPELSALLSSKKPVRTIQCLKGGPITQTVLVSDKDDQYAVALASGPEGSECKTHKHETAVEYYLVISGVVGCVMPGIKKKAKRGGFIFIPENTPHKAVICQEASFLIVTIPSAKGMRHGDILAG